MIAPRFILIASILLLLFAIAARDAPQRRGVVDRFDHYETGFPIDGRHEDVACERCHARGVFKGVPRTCAGCHNTIFAEGKPFRHIPTSGQCETCHTTQDWRLSRFDHTDVVEGCVRCHNNFIGPGKTADHPITSNICADCHNTIHWDQLLPASTGPAQSRQSMPPS